MTRTHTSPAGVAQARIAAVRIANDRVAEYVDRLDQTAAHEPSLLPDWTRGHLLTHLARNADALTNLLVWARTGVEHPAYASRADRDADIAEGSGRLVHVLREDLTAAAGRFATTAADLPDSAWSAQVTTPAGKPMTADRIPLFRLRELWIHLIDLNLGFTPADIPATLLPDLLDDALALYANRPDSPTLSLTLTFPNTTSLAPAATTAYTLTPPANTPDQHGTDTPDPDATTGHAPPPAITGTAAAALAWLTGRSDGAGLTGPLPTLPPWT